MRILGYLLIFFAGTFGVRGDNLVLVKPMMPPEIVVELKSGLSSADVEADVRQHRLARLPTGEEFKAMQLAGASAQLLATAQSPALLADQSDAMLAKLDYAAQQKRSELAQRPQFWIYAEIKGQYPDGSIVATCQTVLPSQTASTLRRANDAMVHFIKPPLPFKLADGRYFINCEAAFVGEFHGKDRKGNSFTAPDLEMVKNLGPLAPLAAEATPTPAEAPAGPSRKPLQLRALIPFNQWLNLASYGGPSVRVHIYSVDMSALRLRFDGWSGPKQVPITSGSDAKTLLLDDGHGCTVFYVDSIDRPDGAVILEFDHTPDSASYPAVAPMSNQTLPAAAAATAGS